MNKIAALVENEPGTYDVFDTFRVSSVNPARVQRFLDAFSSGSPITGMKTTAFQDRATPGAIWNGTDFVDYTAGVHSLTKDWDGMDTYSFICNNKIVCQMLLAKNSTLHDAAEAAFQGNVTLIEVPENQTAKIGSIWDGTHFTDPL